MQNAFFLFSFLIQDRILLWSNLSVYVYEAPTWRFEPLPLLPTPYKHLYLWSDHRTKNAWWLQNLFKKSSKTLMY